jgi:hypothetical protein
MSKLLDSLFFLRTWLNGSAVSTVPRDLEIIGTGITHTTANGRSTFDFSGSPVAVAAPAELGERMVQSGPVAGPYIWIKKRGAIIPDIDLTGTVDARATLQGILNNCRQGAWIDIPDGIVKLVFTGSSADMFTTLPQGVTITGSPRGWKQPRTIYNNGYPDSGTLLKVYGSSGGGRLFPMGVNTMLSDLEISYEDQVRAPATTALNQMKVYGTTLHAQANFHGVTFNNITCHNPYDFIKWEANGGSISHIKGFPLLRGVTFPRCGAAPDMTDIQFNPVGDYRDDPVLLPAWVKANGIVCMMDGVEGYTIRGFQAFGYNVGIMFWDEDNDGFTGCYGNWSGIDFEAMNTVILISNAGRTWQPLANTGGKFDGGTLVPEVAGYGVDFSDTQVPANVNNRPTLYFRNVTMHSSVAGMSRAVWVRAGSYGHLDWDGGQCSQIANEVIRNDSPSGNGRVDLTLLRTPTGSRRKAGVGDIYDNHPIFL